MRKRLTTLKGTRSTGRFDPPKLKPIRRIGKRPPIKGAPLVPPVGGLVRGAISIGSRMFRGSPVTGPTKGALISKAAAGGASTARPVRPRKPTARGGSARAM